MRKKIIFLLIFTQIISINFSKAITSAKTATLLRNMAPILNNIKRARYKHTTKIEVDTRELPDIINTGSKTRKNFLKYFIGGLGGWWFHSQYTDGELESSIDKKYKFTKELIASLYNKTEQSAQYLIKKLQDKIEKHTDNKLPEEDRNILEKTKNIN